MDALGRSPRMRAAMLGVAYFVVGYGSAALDPLVPDRVRFLWRLAAWVASGAIFAAHLGYEHFRRGSLPPVTALHAATAVALGGFLLAAAATVHAALVG